jgi:hypothetical protein
MYKRLFVACVAAFFGTVALLTSGCATIVKGTTQDIPVASDPAGARIAVDGMPMGTTPGKVTLKRKQSHMVSLEKEGYEVENVAVTNSMGGAVAGNIIAGGLIGWGVDAMSGSQYNLHPDTINVRLRPRTAGATAPPTPTTPPAPAASATPASPATTGAAGAAPSVTTPAHAEAAGAGTVNSQTSSAK